jgi:hypothetical protein
MGIRDTLHHRPPGRPDDPNHPHAFKSTGDHWVSDGVPPSVLGGSLSGTSAAIGTGFQFADRLCAVCRREASDPIHTPPD